MAVAASAEQLPRRERIRAVLVSDVRLYREGLDGALSRRDGIAVVATASTIAEGIDAAGAHAPAVVIIDIAMRDSLSGVRALTASAPHAKIVAFAVDEQASDIAAYAEAGIAGYVPCEASIDDLVATIESVIRGEAVCSPRVAGALFKRIAVLAADARPADAFGSLSRREHEILALIRSGLSNKEIAVRLTIEVATVKNHIHNVLTKLHVGSRAQAASLVRPAPIRSRTAAIEI
jgi:two-component system nitrate/nitrite response regulator NarL